jgi:hypothetical protein
MFCIIQSPKGMVEGIQVAMKFTRSDILLPLLGPGQARRQVVAEPRFQLRPAQPRPG